MWLVHANGNFNIAWWRLADQSNTWFFQALVIDTGWQSAHLLDFIGKARVEKLSRYDFNLENWNFQWWLGMVLNVVNFSQIFSTIIFVDVAAILEFIESEPHSKKYLSHQLHKLQAVALHNSEKDQKSTFLIVTF